ncbi:MAG: hypothetical protein WD077_11185 [Bacteroidia bacterium]
MTKSSFLNVARIWAIRRLLWVLPCFLLCFVPSCKKDPLLGNDIEIRHVYFLNTCAGYCTREIILSPGTVTYIKSGPNDSVFPEIRITEEVTEEQWQRLRAAIPYNHLSRMQDTIGCPTCDDRVGETLQVTRGDFQKSVSMELTVQPSPIQPLLEILREINFSFP